MKYLIVGLGNPGAEYENTRHNIGFKVLDALYKDQDESFKTEKLGDICQLKHKGRTMVLLKPNTYMNLSGKAVNYWMQKEKIPLERLLVITDDIALPFGKIRMRAKGSAGGHNGLKDIEATLNSQAYSRIRFGVGNDFSKGQQVNYVLSQWSNIESVELSERLDHTIKMIQSFVTIGVARTMSLHNNK
ncbi:MAG: aminoacyl-tRNA hydrolase [Flavobacteriales bacterium]|nr:aminoacyl-tRNA hydrolase [Flavobacteriales bacterium]